MITPMLVDLLPPVFTQTILVHNSIAQWLLAILTTIAGVIVLRVIKYWVGSILHRLAKTTPFHIDDLLARHIDNIGGWLLWALALPLGCQWLNLSNGIETVVTKLPLIAAIAQLFLWTSPSIDFALQRYIDSRPTEADRINMQTMTGPIRFTGLLVAWSLLALLALQNLGVDVTALIAGLGIGGVAIALAVQNILGDLFAAFSIVVDKPFVVGDFLVIGDFAGNVSHIGLKTTRIQSLSGEELVFANSDLLNSRIKNFRPMKERRILFRIGVLYSTPADKLEGIPTLIRQIINSHENLRFDRSHVAGFGDSSVDIETVYFVLDPEYGTYMDAQQAINLSLFREFAEQGIDFAFPTRTLIVEQDKPFQIKSSLHSPKPDTQGTPSDDTN